LGYIGQKAPAGERKENYAFKFRTQEWNTFPTGKGLLSKAGLPVRRKKKTQSHSGRRIGLRKQD
jgi:hypothetical protein